MKRLPATTDHEVSNQIAKTREFWRPRYGRDLSDEEVSDISRNLTGFFGVLADWSRAERLAAARSDAKPSTPAAEASHGH